nr:RNA-directed DNA polymerase, eukaryota [Tanacetum cinerariifolium]
MANSIGFRTNSNPEIKRNIQHVNNRNHEQRNQGIPSKTNLNFRVVHKSYSSIFVSNIPWKATVQDRWDSCNQWGVVIDVYIAAKRSKSGHRFGFVRFKNVNDINLLVSNLRVTWMGGFYLFADVAKYGRANNRLEERSGDNKPNEGMNTQPIRDNVNVFQSFNSYTKAVLGNKSVGVSGNNDASNSGEKPVAVSVSNKANEESSNEALMFISEDDCIDLDGMECSILAKVKDLSVITDLLKYMSSEGFVDVGLRYVGGRWVWLEFDSTDQVESVKNSKVLNELFLELKYVSYDFIPDEKCVWIDLVGLPLASWAPEVYKKLGGRWGCSVFTDMVNDGPLSHGKVCVLTESLHRVLESFKVSYRNRSYCITATEFAYWAPNIESTEDKSMTNSLERKDDEGPSLEEGPKHEVDVRGVDSDHVDSFEEDEIIGDPVLNNDGCVKDCMEKNVDDDVEKDIKDCFKNVTEKCGMVNNNMSNNVEGEILEDHFDDVPGATQEDLFGHDARPRPAGKPRPAKKTKSDATASTDGSSASTKFGKLMEQELRLKREAVERAFEAQAEKDRTLMRLEELRFLATSTKDLDDDDAFWIKKQKRLIKNKMRNDLGDEDDEDQ